MTQQFVENLMQKLSNEIVENSVKRAFLSDLISSRDRRRGELARRIFWMGRLVGNSFLPIADCHSRTNTTDQNHGTANSCPKPSP
jgi:hypothetical protein